MKSTLLRRFFLTALLASSCVIAVAQEARASLAAGETGRIAFASSNRAATYLDLFKHRAKFDETIVGDLIIPANAEAKAPAMIVMHSSGGINPGTLAWVAFFNQMGIATFMVDSFTPRGIQSTATDQSLLSYPATVTDGLKALELLPRTVVLKYAGYETVGHVGFIREFQALAGSLGLTDRVEFVGTPPTRPALYSLACTADIGLSLFARVFREPMAGASNKPFDYLACGLALIVPNTPEWTELYVNAGVARSADPESPESIAAAIQWFIDHPDETRAMRERGRQRILNEWNYETQFAPVKQLLESLVR